MPTALPWRPGHQRPPLLQIEAEYQPLGAESRDELMQNLRALQRFEACNQAVQPLARHLELEQPLGMGHVAQSGIDPQPQAAPGNPPVAFEVRRPAGNRVQVREIGLVESEALDQPSGDRLRRGIRGKHALHGPILVPPPSHAAHHLASQQIDNREDAHRLSVACTFEGPGRPSRPDPGAPQRDKASNALRQRHGRSIGDRQLARGCRNLRATSRV
jgi:hypothetical protein